MSHFSIRGRLALGAGLSLGAVIVEDGRIARIVRGPSSDLPGPIVDSDIVAPGYIDLQVNGGFGLEVGTDAGAIAELVRRLPATGVTGFLATAITSTPEQYNELFRSFDQVRGISGARPLGLHLEGPFLSPIWHGAHRRDLIEGTAADLFDRLLEHPDLRLMTLAPERPGALELITRLCERGVVVSLGHTDASYEEFIAGVDAGASMATHLFNAMSPFHHREPGSIGAALVDDRVTVSLIADGLHCHPAGLALALHAKGTERVVLVTDRAPVAGLAPGAYAVDGRTLVVAGSSIRLEDGTLAGSGLTMDQAVRNMVRWTGITEAVAIRMATELPARVLGLTQTGSIRAGFDADLVLLDDALEVQATIVRGERLYSRESSPLAASEVYR